LRARKERLPNEQAEHQAVLDALQAGDGPALDVALRRHLARSLDDAAGDLRKVEPNQERNGQKREDNDEKLARMILVAGVVLLAPTYDAAGQGAPPTTIRMWTFLNPAGTSPREVALADIIASFERANPEIKVSVEPQVWDQMSPKFLAAAHAGNAPDVTWVVTDLLGQAKRSGELADLRPLFINRWSDAQRAGHKDAYWDACGEGAKQYCPVLSRNYIGILYRRDLLQQVASIRRL
jgi:maltose-binding protein MalE